MKRLLCLIATLILLLCCVPAFAERSAEKVETLTEALDYSNRGNWAYFSMGEDKPADLFLICPTVDTRSYANALDLNEKLKSRFIRALDQEKGVYEDSCRIYSPYYRQMSINAYKLNDDEFETAYKNACLDVFAAFRWYLDNENNGRPIILAGFSQGSQLCIRLMKEFFGDNAEGNELYSRLIAVYAIGWRVTDEDIAECKNIVPAKGEDDTGVVICYECENGSVEGSIIIPEGVKTYSINPLNWRTDSTPADKTLNLGAVLVADGEPVPGFCGAYIDEGRGSLIVPDVSTKDYPPALDVFPEGCFHIYDIMFFYTNLKNNVALRAGKNIDQPAQPVAAGGADIDYLLALQSFREKTGFLVPIFEKLCELNVLLLPAICVFLYLAVNKRLGRLALVNFNLSEIANLLVKNVACVFRPYIRDARVIPTKMSSSYSFPSGHSMYATSIYGTFAAWLWKRVKWLSIVMLLLAALTGFARNYLGAHTPQDVFVSVFLTVLVMVLMTTLLSWLEEHPEKSTLFIIIGAVLGIAVLVFLNAKSYPMNTNAEGKLLVDPFKTKTEVFTSVGKWLGFLLAMFLDVRFIRFSVPKKKIVGFAGGLIGALIICSVTYVINKAKTLPLGAHWGSFVISFAAWVIVLTVIPAVMKRLDAKK